MAEYSKAIKYLYFDKVKGIVTESEYIDFSCDFVSEKKRLEILLQQLQKNMNKIDERMNGNDIRKEIIKEYIDIDCLDREIVQNLLNIFASESVLKVQEMYLLKYIGIFRFQF